MAIILKNQIRIKI